MLISGILTFMCICLVTDSQLLKESETKIFDEEEAFKNIWLSAAAYCGSKNIKSDLFKGVTEGFVVSYTFDGILDTEGFVGYLPSDSSIYVVFRGSSNIENWMTNMDISKTEYDGYNCGTGGEVHRGFYRAEQDVFPGILAEVQHLKSIYSSFSVKCTGHSLGAALAQLTAMDLQHNGINIETLYNFGQPRIGDENYALCASNYLSIQRVTYLKDPVPHLPFHFFGYKHSCYEAYQSSTLEVVECQSSNCEQSSCSAQWEFYETNIDDHMVYMGLPVTCEAIS